MQVIRETSPFTQTSLFISSIIQLDALGNGNGMGSLGAVLKTLVASCPGAGRFSVLVLA